MPEPTQAEKRELFERHFLLGRLNSQEIDALLAYTRVERYGAGREIFSKGSPGDSMMAVLKGRVKISSLSPEGKEIVLNIISPGEIFGEIALLDGKERTADATAMGDCELLVLSRRDFLPFLERRGDLGLLLLSVLCERLRRTSEQVEDALFRHLQSRRAETLLRLGRSTGAPRGRALHIDLKLSQRDLARYAVVTPLNDEEGGGRERPMLTKGVKQLLAEANAAIETVSVGEARRLFDDGDVVFIDVREGAERAKGYIPGSVHAPRGFLEFIADPEAPTHHPAFSSGKRLLLYCGSGARSALAAKTLADMGLKKVCHMDDGFGAWVQAGGPVER